jgi:tetratricopeptide (TPR) repeat protein
MGGGATIGASGHDTDTIGADPTLGEGSPRDTLAPLAPGTKVGRYVIESPLGAGGMGVVYAALDPKLERKVAVKLVHAGPGQTSQVSGGTSTGASRLLREAQAMAKLHHRNIVVVHDVGTVGEQVFIAMEYLDGGTLRRWVELERPGWRAILERWLAAGEGLAAAHAAGIVHRDFKPENVLLGTDGRVCVVDFGLARGAAAGPTHEVETASITETGALGLRLTQTGAVMGTPAYMAPEQHEGRIADARSDQFAFCVSLYEALYGRRPFDGDTLTTLVVNVVEGNLRQPEAGHGVPRYLLSILARGLQVDPAARHASMPELLAALPEDPTRRRRSWRGWALGGIVAVGGVAAGVMALVEDESSVCAGAPAQIADAWNDARRDEIATAMAEHDAADAWAKAATTLDGYAEQWAEMHTEACEATRVRGEQSEDMLDRRMVCLAQRRGALANLAAFLAAPDRDIVRRLPQLVAALEPIADCGDTEALLAEGDGLPAEGRERILAAYAAISRVRNLRTAIKLQQAHDALAALGDEVQQLAYDPLTAQYKYLRAATFADLGRTKEAEDALYEAAIFASKIGEDGLSATAWTALARLVGITLGRSTEVDPILKAAEAAVARVPDSAYHRGALMSTKGTIAVLNEDNVRAEAALREAYALMTEAHGPEHDNALETREMLALALQGQDKLEEAEMHLQQILDIRESQVGPDHPALASLLGNLGLIRSARGDYVEAERLYQRCHELLVRGFGPEHQAVVTSLLNLANAQRRQGKVDEAKRNLDDALALGTKLFGDGPRLAWLHQARARLFAARGEHETALEEGRVAEAQYTEAYGAEYPRVADALLVQGKALTDLGRAHEAVGPLERAAEIRAAVPDAQPEDRAELDFELARALWDADVDRPRARKSAEAARDALASSDDEAARTEVTQWLATHE